jgi:FKBP-type peptidyl-prolyl cis-trans isomerase
MLRNKWFLSGLAILVLIGGAAGAWMYVSKPRTPKQKMGYSIGAQVGASLMRQGVEVDAAAVGAAVRDILAGGKMKLTDEELAQANREYQEAVQKVVAEEGKKNQQSSQAFLATNAQRKEVQTHESGLQIEVLKPGQGKRVGAVDTVLANFRGTLINGTEIESSAKGAGRALALKVDQLIPGLRIGLQLMTEDAVFRFFVPPNLAYGAQPRPGIPPESVLIYEIEIVKIQGAAPPPAPPADEKKSDGEKKKRR